MKRSFMDARIEAMLTMCERCGARLPPFALWREEDYRADPAAAARIFEGGLGWSVVEFQPDQFAELGLTLFTLRMADWRQLSHGRGRLYAEKALLVEAGQRTPHHYHIVKSEDIINRGGAKLVVELFKVDRGGAPLKEKLRVLKDVKSLELSPGAHVTLEPGESLTLEPFVAHAFWAEGGATLGGEVSLANDDRTDNYFLSALPPPAPVDEDAPRRYVTVRDLPKLVALV
jgi:D-lyxose ketol-isomerase